jgi:hypothetical protein
VATARIRPDQGLSIYAVWLLVHVQACVLWGCFVLCGPRAQTVVVASRAVRRAVLEVVTASWPPHLTGGSAGGANLVAAALAPGFGVWLA